MQGLQRWWIAVAVAAGLGTLAWTRRGRSGTSAGTPAGADVATLQDVFDEFPETDNPEVVRLFLAWKLAERLSDGLGVDGQLALFGKLYRQVRRLT